MQHSRTKFLAVVSLSIFLVSVIGCVSFFLLVSKKEVSYIEQNEERAKKIFYMESVRTLMGSLEETADERASLISRIPTEDSIVNLITLIEALGKEQGGTLTIDALTIKPVNATFETLFVNLTVKGSYESVLHTLKLLENIPYQSRVNKVQMIQIGENMDTDLWSATFELQITKFKKT